MTRALVRASRRTVGLKSWCMQTHVLSSSRQPVPSEAGLLENRTCSGGVRGP
jgi:hypothetical protein